MEITEVRSVGIDRGSAAALHHVAVLFSGHDISPIVYFAIEGERGLVGLRLVDKGGKFTGLSMELQGDVRIVDEPTYTLDDSESARLRAWDHILSVIEPATSWEAPDRRRRMVARVTTLRSLNHIYALPDAHVGIRLVGAHVRSPSSPWRTMWCSMGARSLALLSTTCGLQARRESAPKN